MNLFTKVYLHIYRGRNCLVAFIIEAATALFESGINYHTCTKKIKLTNYCMNPRYLFLQFDFTLHFTE
jgi:hypothetical protein